MRTTEARLLECCNIDLMAGIINICHTKGYNEHRVALHESMRQVLEIYDKKMDAIMPGRKTFFPNEYDRPYSDAWVVPTSKNCGSGSVIITPVLGLEKQLCGDKHQQVVWGRFNF